MKKAIQVARLHGLHRLGLAEHAARSVQFALLNKLNGKLLVEVHQLALGEAKLRNGLQHHVPPPVVYVRHDALYIVNRIEHNIRLLL